MMVVVLSELGAGQKDVVVECVVVVTSSTPAYI